MLLGGQQPEVDLCGDIATDLSEEVSSIRCSKSVIRVLEYGKKK